MVWQVFVHAIHRQIAKKTQQKPSGASKPQVSLCKPADFKQSLQFPVIQFQLFGKKYKKKVFFIKSNTLK